MSKKKREPITDERKAIDDYIKKHGVKKCKGVSLGKFQTGNKRGSIHENLWNE